MTPAEFNEEYRDSLMADGERAACRHWFGKYSICAYGCGTTAGRPAMFINPTECTNVAHPIEPIAADEEWRPVPEFEDMYAVSNHGRVFSYPRVVWTQPHHRAVRRGRLLKHTMAGNIRKLYPTVTFTQGQRRRVYRVHVLVAVVFIGPKPTGADVLHWDDDVLNTHVSNLRYGTDSDNALDRVRNGRDRNANKAFCNKGHKFTPENTYVRERPNMGSAGWTQRMCRQCGRDNWNRYNQKRKSA